MSSQASPYSANNSQEYLKTRVDFKTEAYRAKGAFYRWGYLIMTCTSAIAAASVPVLINLNGVPSRRLSRQVKGRRIRSSGGACRRGHLQRTGSNDRDANGQSG